MTAQGAVLQLGAITLTGCGAGLMLLHGNNPLLRGLNWMGRSLLLGGASAALLMGTGAVPALQPLVNLCILLAFICCYRADQYLIGTEAQVSLLSPVLLSCEAVAACLEWFHVVNVQVGIAVVSVLIAVQLEATAALIRRNRQGKGHTAARFTTGLMHFLMLANVARAICAAAGLLSGSPYAEQLNLVTYNIFVAAAIGLAFAFFWRTTSKLSLELQHMASTDPLTRVYNRRVFLNWCETEQVRSRRSGISFSVLMLDFDHFKKINDTFGHHVGDQVLCAAVERIQDSVRGIDVLCRWGGEEFAVLLPNASQEATEIVAQRIRQNIRAIKSADQRFAGPEFTQLSLSASIGGATYFGPEDSFESMLQRADGALYQAKREGRNRVIHATHDQDLSTFTPAALALEAN